MSYETGHSILKKLNKCLCSSDDFHFLPLSAFLLFSFFFRNKEKHTCLQHRALAMFCSAPTENTPEFSFGYISQRVFHYWSTRAHLESQGHSCPTVYVFKAGYYKFYVVRKTTLISSKNKPCDRFTLCLSLLFAHYWIPWRKHIKRRALVQVTCCFTLQNFTKYIFWWIGM